MARGKGGGGGNRGAPSKVARGRGGGKPKTSGIEKYGYDEADEVLKLHEDGVGLSDDGGNDSDEGGEYDEEDVMGFDPEDEETKPAKRKAVAKKAAADEEEDEDDDALAGDQEAKGPATTAGWRGRDFYGGDDAGDDSEGASEEEMIMEEARKLEELRVARLAGHEDLLGSLVASDEPKAAKDGDAADKASVSATHAGASAALEAAAAAAQFESVFAAEAEKSSIQRDLSSLSEGQKRGLMKKEAPEMLPLLEDFKGKLAQLQEMLPLLTPPALKRLPASGKAYLEAKASLLLSTLANLSFYLLVRAEGGGVRAHPVVSQLVWLRELHEKLGPIDEKLAGQLRKSLKVAQQLPNGTTAAPADTPITEEKTGSTARVAEAMTPVAKRRLSLRERLEKLRKSLPSPAAASSATASRLRAPATKDLLKMPSRRKAPKNAELPDDLDEADPTLGYRRLGTPLGEQISSMQTLFRERAAKEQAPSADRDVDAKPRRARERLSEAPEPGPLQRGHAEAEDDDEGEEDNMVKQARKAAKAKKSKKAAEHAAKEAARAARQYHPEEVVDGKRKATKKILDNRGLVRQRKKKSGNARVTNRDKYDKLVKRRRGAVVDMREGAADGATYAGEATGLRTHVKKSLKLG